MRSCCRNPENSIWHLMHETIQFHTNSPSEAPLGNICSNFATFQDMKGVQECGLMSVYISPLWCSTFDFKHLNTIV